MESCCLFFLVIVSSIYVNKGKIPFIFALNVSKGLYYEFLYFQESLNNKSESWKLARTIAIKYHKYSIKLIPDYALNLKFSFESKSLESSQASTNSQVDLLPC